MKQWCAILPLIALAMDCSGPTQSAGGSSDSGNPRVVAMVRTADGSPAAGATVRLRRSDWVMPLPALAKPAIYGADALTDDSGRFEITGVDPGSYRIEVTDGNSAVLFACSLDLRDTLDLGIDTLRPFAAINGSADASGVPGARRYVQVYGLDHLAAVGPSGTYAMRDLPAGTLRLRIVSADSTAVNAVTIDSVRTVSGSVTEVPMAGWRFLKRLILNTAAAGANVSGNVTGFPLAVRLDAASLDFTQARDSGQDLRFTKADGSMLPYEIEHWDASARTAAVWVRMDTVRGNDSTQFIQMHWGNPAAVSASNGAAVFDTADGYAGVWHLGGNTRDATGFRNDPSSSSIPSTTGVIANGRAFDGTDVLRVPDQAGGGALDPAGRSFTLSAWFRSTDTSATRLISKGHYNFSNGYYLGYGNGRICASIGSDGDTAQTVFFFTNDQFNDGQWHLAMAVFDRTAGRGRIYVDGMLRDVSSPAGLCGTALGSEHDFSTCVLLSTRTSDDLAIGGCLGDGRFLTGDVDEARILMNAPPEAWSKLAYENQRSGQRLVGFTH